MLVLTLAVGLALVISFVCSISEAVLLSVTHSQIQALGKSRAAKTLRRFKREIDVPIAAILVLNTVANTVGAAVAGASYIQVFGVSSLWVFSLSFTLAILFFSEIVPKTLGVTFVAQLAMPVAMGVQVLVWVLRPVLFLTRNISGILRRGQLAPVTSIDEIRLLAALGRTEGAVGARTASMIEGAAALRELTAYDVMVPRVGVVFLSGQSSLEENLRKVRNSGHSRFPYAPDGDLDHVSGILLVKDLLFALHEEPEKIDYEALLRPVTFVPEGMRLERLLRTFQEERRHLAVVVNEYGGAQGIVALEDVLEEIVGEIEDESDRVDPFIVRRLDGALVCRGWAEARKVFELLRVDDQEIESVTIGGFLADLLGRVPKVGDSVEFGGYEFKVLRATARRAERVEIRRLAAPTEATPMDN